MGKKTRKTQMARIFKVSEKEEVAPVENPVSEQQPAIHGGSKVTSLRTPELQRKLVGRGIHNGPAESTCLCARPKAKVFCHFCGYIRIGRKKIQCPQHPSVHFLYDVESCQKCHAHTWYLEECLG